MKGGPILSRDQLTMYYNVGTLDSKIWVTHRRHVSDGFEAGDVVTIDPGFTGIQWPEALSADGCTLYFVERRDGHYRMMMATRAK